MCKQGICLQAGGVSAVASLLRPRCEDEVVGAGLACLAAFISHTVGAAAATRERAATPISRIGRLAVQSPFGSHPVQVSAPAVPALEVIDPPLVAVVLGVLERRTAEGEVKAGLALAAVQLLIQMTAAKATAGQPLRCGCAPTSGLVLPVQHKDPCPKSAGRGLR